MAENIPPSANGMSADATRGVPYYEKLKKDLRETINKKRLLDRNMSQLEEQIFKFESTYLEETAAGNIIKGFDTYIKGSSASGAGASTTSGTASRRKGGITDQDRVFSRSSASFTRVIELTVVKESSPQSSTQTTPSHAPTPTASHPLLRDSNPTPTSATSHKGGGNTKKYKKGAQKEEDDESDGKPPKRLKITYARGEKGAD